jgi:arsenate reductase-like glutaredoxin family protein
LYFKKNIKYTQNNIKIWFKVLVKHTKMSSAFQPWSKEEEERLLKSIHNRQPIYNIAKEHNRSIKAIEMRVENLVRRMFTEGTNVKEISKLIHRSEGDIEKILDTQMTTGTKNNNQNDRIQNIEEILKKIVKKQKVISEKLDLIIKKGCP